jgi:cell division protein FtsI/penicillin-binding protein 2
VGIIINDGLRLPTRRLESLHFATGTPFETNFEYSPPPPERVLNRDVARVLRGALLDVVEHGTARRAFHCIRHPDGSHAAIGGKTGTGDHRFETFGRGGRLIESRVVSRTATFIFMIDDRFFGVITAIVSGKDADRYDFTSSLPVAIFASMEPLLKPLLREPPVPKPEAEPAATPESETDERVLQVADAAKTNL